MSPAPAVRRERLFPGIGRLIVGLITGVIVPFLFVADGHGSSGSAAAAEGRSLSLEERVAAQKAIEQVYWNHRIWPKENPGPKPPLSAVLPDAAIRTRVEDMLRKSNALERYWHRPVTAAQLQAELNRIAAHTHDPQVLQELFAALGNDARLIAESLTRQSLVDRLIRNWYATDERFHGALEKKAKAALAACQSVECMPAMGGEYRETTLRVKAPAAEKPESPSHRDVVRLDEEEWKKQLKGLADRFGRREGSLPVGKLSGLEEAPQAFVVTAVLSRDKDEVKTATVTWPKVSFDAWWTKESGSLGTHVEDSSRGFTLPLTAPSGCAVDTWDALHGDFQGRYLHTALWTGTEMIVWGGSPERQGEPGFSLSFLNTGARYNPSTDSWMLTSTAANVPVASVNPTAVWTGREMIVWGGLSRGGDLGLNTGGRYDPSTDTWTPTSTGANVPAGRWGHLAVWTGTEMIIWGGYNIGLGYLNTGGRYDPSTDTWTPTSTGANVPEERWAHTVVWTGTEMIIWGGYNDNVVGLNTGGRYDPSTDTWTPTSYFLQGRWNHTAVWTGTEMIIWGGFGNGALNTGGRYDPSTDTWTPTSTGANVPAVRGQHSAVWSGAEMIIWGGYSGGVLNTGGRYDPSTDTWTPTSTGANVPGARTIHTAVWTGTEMIVWGGYSGVSPVNTGGRYDPSTDTWTPTLTPTSLFANVPAARAYHTAVWTGAEMIIWGGYGDSFLSSGGRYDPSTDTWRPTSSGPAQRSVHTAVWTGTEMIVWGGSNGTTDLNTGGRYDPSTDTWRPTSTGGNAPSARHGYTAVWTGAEMIVWGGFNGTTDLNTGGRYDPSTDTWIPTSIGANAPAGRFLHTAVWTGTEMIIWGGADSFGYMNTGARYTPSTDTWTPTSTGASVPAGGWGHTAVWTGTKMIIWGGTSSYGDDDFGNLYNIPNDAGGRYDPATDTWAPTSTGPEVRFSHTAIWTGSEMIVWAGADSSCDSVCCDEFCDNFCLSCNVFMLSSGGRYNPSTDAWAPTSTGANLPGARLYRSAVWTGTEVIVWGGSGVNSSSLQDGGLYCACPNGTLYYRDADGDGYGDPGVVGTSCDGTIPAGYLADHADCNDTSASVHPGAMELCNAVDDDCNSSIDDAAPPGAVGSVMFGADSQTIAWAPRPEAQSYDVVYGDLAQLHASGGDFTAATLGCLADRTAEISADFSTLPQIGQAFWVLVRGNNCAGTGTYDSGDPSQVGSRDAEIDASPRSCKESVCGDNHCNGSETCSTCPVDCGLCPCTDDSECQPATCCHPTTCITIWETQACGGGTCDPGCWFCLRECVCQGGTCIPVF